MTTNKRPSDRKAAGPSHYAPNTKNATQYAAITAYVAAYGPSSFETLFALFADKAETTWPNKTFRNRLGKLVERGQLESTGSQQLRLWSLAPGVVAPATAYTPKTRQPAPEPTRAMVVPPRQHNVLLGTYQPPRNTHVRAGAQDYANVPSRGVRC